MSTADTLMIILNALIEFNATPEKFMTKPVTPPAIERPAPKIKRCKWPCERRA